MISTSDFNLKIEQLKIEQHFDTYIETLGYYLENETDQEPDKVAKHLNKKIIEEIQKEANELGMLKEQEELIQLL
jgi:hypothetical protein